MHKVVETMVSNSDQNLSFNSKCGPHASGSYFVKRRDEGEYKSYITQSVAKLKPPQSPQNLKRFRKSSSDSNLQSRDAIPAISYPSSEPRQNAESVQMQRLRRHLRQETIQRHRTSKQSSSLPTPRFRKTSSDPNLNASLWSSTLKSNCTLRKSKANASFRREDSLHHPHCSPHDRMRREFRKTNSDPNLSSCRRQKSFSSAFGRANYLPPNEKVVPSNRIKKSRSDTSLRGGGGTSSGRSIGSRLSLKSALKLNQERAPGEKGKSKAPAWPKLRRRSKTLRSEQRVTFSRKHNTVHPALKREAFTDAEASDYWFSKKEIQEFADASWDIVDEFDAHDRSKPFTLCTRGFEAYLQENNGDGGKDGHKQRMKDAYAAVLLWGRGLKPKEVARRYKTVSDLSKKIAFEYARKDAVIAERIQADIAKEYAAYRRKPILKKKHSFTSLGRVQTSNPSLDLLETLEALEAEHSSPIPRHVYISHAEDDCVSLIHDDEVLTDVK